MRRFSLSISRSSTHKPVFAWTTLFANGCLWLSVADQVSLFRFQTGASLSVPLHGWHVGCLAWQSSVHCRILFHQPEVSQTRSCTCLEVLIFLCQSVALLSAFPLCKFERDPTSLVLSCNIIKGLALGCCLFSYLAGAKQPNQVGCEDAYLQYTTGVQHEVSEVQGPC